MSQLGVTLKARNSSGEQELVLSDDEAGYYYYFTLHGVYKDRKIQIDFDELTNEELKDIRVMIDLIMEESER